MIYVRSGSRHVQEPRAHTQEATCTCPKGALLEACPKGALLDVWPNGPLDRGTAEGICSHQALTFEQATDRQPSSTAPARKQRTALVGSIPGELPVQWPVERPGVSKSQVPADERR